MSAPAKKKSSKEALPPVIIVKKVRHKGGHHGGAWKVAYADFVTTMMALFIVLWAAGQDTAIRSSIASYFRNPTAPTAKTGGQGSGVLPASTGAVDRAEALPDPLHGEAKGERQALEQAATEIKKGFESDPNLKELAKHVRIEVLAEGLRIQIVDENESLFFEVGSARVRAPLTRLLGIIAQVVGKLPNEVMVEGHTDARRYSKERSDYSNWELSADRANSARRLLDSSGLRAGQVTRVVGFADHDPLVKDNPLDPQNRRVSILVARMRPAEPVPTVNARAALEQMRSTP